MNYFPQSQFKVDSYSNMASLHKSHPVFSGKTTQQALEMCAKPFQQAEKIFISNFYETFEGFLLS